MQDEEEAEEAVEDGDEELLGASGAASAAVHLIAIGDGERQPDSGDLSSYFCIKTIFLK